MSMKFSRLDPFGTNEFFNFYWIHAIDTIFIKFNATKITFYIRKKMFKSRLKIEIFKTDLV